MFFHGLGGDIAKILPGKRQRLLGVNISRQAKERVGGLVGILVVPVEVLAGEREQVGFRADDLIAVGVLPECAQLHGFVQ